MLEYYYRKWINFCVRWAGADAPSAQPDQRIMQVIRSLPRRRREAFLLHRFDGLSHAEIARRMQTSSQMVEQHVRLALRACRQAPRVPGSAASGMSAAPGRS
ncbi:sigma-70 region 4 domain-containing protein [Alcaligenes sp. SDU_A2]|uniref:sigma-70 region 4 domain-containing protein n=1 Tax=Alcaligenes sp. SDU_A2 TaxID=3136634 RepID=UPI00311E67A6